MIFTTKEEEYSKIGCLSNTCCGNQCTARLRAFIMRHWRFSKGHLCPQEAQYFETMSKSHQKSLIGAFHNCTQKEVLIGNVL
jgi:hypothetical protein